MCVIVHMYNRTHNHPPLPPSLLPLPLFPLSPTSPSPILLLPHPPTTPSPIPPPLSLPPPSPLFTNPCPHHPSTSRPLSFSNTISPARPSGCYRLKSANRSPRHGTLNSSGRRKSKKYWLNLIGHSFKSGCGTFLLQQVLAVCS